MCQEKFVQIYTKTFGGKIWSNLHRVSADNFLDKKLKIAPLENFRQNMNKHNLVQNII